MSTPKPKKHGLTVGVILAIVVAVTVGAMVSN